MQGPFDDGKGLSPGNKPLPQGRSQKSHVRASKKSNFRQGSFAEGEGLTGKKSIPGRGASKNFISCKGRLTMARASSPFLAGAPASKKSYFRQGSKPKKKRRPTRPKCKETKAQKARNCKMEPVTVLINPL